LDLFLNFWSGDAIRVTEDALDLLSGAGESHISGKCACCWSSSSTQRYTKKQRPHSSRTIDGVKSKNV
jgi:hypothetical protein